MKFPSIDSHVILLYTFIYPLPLFKEVMKEEDKNILLNWHLIFKNVFFLRNHGP